MDFTYVIYEQIIFQIFLEQIFDNLAHYGVPLCHNLLTRPTVDFPHVIYEQFFFRNYIAEQFSDYVDTLWSTLVSYFIDKTYCWSPLWHLSTIFFQELLEHISDYVDTLEYPCVIFYRQTYWDILWISSITKLFFRNYLNKFLIMLTQWSTLFLILFTRHTVDFSYVNYERIIFSESPEQCSNNLNIL